MSCDDDSVNITCSNFPRGGDYSAFQSIIDMGLGIGAQFVGIPYRVYRITSTSNGDIINPDNLIFSAYPAMRQKYKTDYSGDIGLETLDKQNFVYSILGDMSPMKLGDIFVQADPVYGAGYTSPVYATQEYNGFCIASLAALKSRIAGRIDRNIQVYRPPTGANSDGYFDWTLDNCDQLVCVNGALVLQSREDYPSAVASLIPAGFQSSNKLKGAEVINVPDNPPKASYACYVMPLPDGTVNGFTFREGDRIVEQGGARYVVTNPYRQDTGFVGTYLTIERMTSQPS